jgi:hypothetical protein
VSAPKEPRAEDGGANATRRRLLTGTAVGLAALTSGSAAGLWPAAPAQAASTGTGTGTGRTVLSPSNDTSGQKDTAAINSALLARYNAQKGSGQTEEAAPGPVVYLSAGVYYTNAPIVVPPGVSLRGLIGAAQSGDAPDQPPGAVLVPVNGWAPGSTQLTGYPGAGQDNLLLHQTGTLAATMPRAAASSAVSRLASGTLYVTAIALPAGLTVSRCTMFVNSTAASGVTFGGYVLLDHGMKVLAVTASQASAWAQAGTGYTATFAGPYRVTTAGVHYVGVVIGVGASGQMPALTGALPLAKGIAALAGVSPQAPAYCGTSSTGLEALPAAGTRMAGVTTNGEYVLYATLA